MSLLRSGVAHGLLMAIALLAGEIGARLDDRLFIGTPVLENPTFERLFFQLEDGIRRGVPHARFKKIQLNGLGLLGPELELERRPGCERWLFLGASETFGEASMAGSDYPSKVRAALPPGRCVEVANAASPGLDLRAVIAQYNGALFRLAPDVVFVYPPTHFYLGELRDRNPVAQSETATPPGALPPPRASSEPFDVRHWLDASRLLERLRDTAEVPRPLQRLRTQRWIDQALAQHPSDWPFRVVPEDRLAAYEGDLEYLVGQIRESGATPVILVHAVRVANPPRPEDAEDLIAVRTFTPRAPPEVFAAFEYEAAERTRATADRLGVRRVDLAAALNGKRDLFLDAIHFTPEAAARVARMILDAVSSESAAERFGALQ